MSNKEEALQFDDLVDVSSEDEGNDGLGQVINRMIDNIKTKGTMNTTNDEIMNEATNEPASNQ